MWNCGYEEHDRSGKPEQNSWDSLGKVDPHRGEHLLGRTAYSARYEETIHDRTGQPVSENLQGKADFENFNMGSETTNFSIKSETKCELDRKECQALQRTAPNIQ